MRDADKAQALTDWVEAYQKTLLNLCCMILKDYALAEDAVQETFIKAYRSCESFRGQCSIKTWLTKIAVNTCRDMKKSSWFLHVNRSFSPIILPDTPSSSDDTLDLADAMLKLSDRHRVVVLLYYDQEMTMQEIADVLGLSLSAVSKRLKKALEKLQVLLREEDADETH